MATVETRDARTDQPLEPISGRAYPTLAHSIGLLLARVPLGVYFIVASVNKFRAEGGIPAFVDSNLADATKYMSESMSRMYLQSLPYAEIALGALLVVGLLTRVAAFICTALLVSFTIAGGMWMGKLPFHPNLVYMGMLAALVLLGGGWISADRILFGARRKVKVTREYTERV